MQAHYLKTRSTFFEETLSLNKLFEARKNDRNFQVGDQLYLQETVGTDTMTGRVLGPLTVVYILHGPCCGIGGGHCVMQLRPEDIFAASVKLAGI